MSDVKQFKLNSGEEIVCEIVDYADEEYCDILIRRAFEIKCILAPDQTRFYAMKPWMSLQEGRDKYINLNTNHIVGEGSPSKQVMTHYKNCVKESEMTKEQIEERMANLSNKLQQVMEKEQIMEEEDSLSNVISFNPKRTFH